MSLQDFGTYSILLAIIALFGALFLQPNAQYVKFLFRRNSDRIFLGISLQEIALLLISVIVVFFAIGAIEESWLAGVILAVYLLSLMVFGIRLDLVNINLGALDYYSISLIRWITLMVILFGSTLFLAKVSLSFVLLIQLIALIVAMFCESRIKDRVPLILRVVSRDDNKAKRDFSVPLVISGTLLWSMSSMDRIVLGWTESNDIVGLYSANLALGVKIPSLIYPMVIASLTKNLFTSDEYFQKWWGYRFWGLFFGIMFLLAVVGVLWMVRFKISALFLTSDFGSYSWLIPIGFASGGLLALSFILETFFFVKGKTQQVLISNVLLSMCMIISYVIFWKYGTVNALATGTLLAPSIKLVFLSQQKM